LPAPRRTIRIFLLLLAGLLCLLAARTAAAQSPPKPLSKTEIVNLLEAQMPPDRLAEVARKRGIDFQVTPEIEKELRQAGATSELLTTLREVTPPPPKPQPALLQIEGAPKGAKIYVDDEFKGQVSREGRLKIPGLSPEKHVLRVSAQGFKEKVETLELAPGETRTYTPSLVSAVVSPPAPKPLLEGPNFSLFYESLGESAKITIEVHAGDSPVLYVDVNGDGHIDHSDTAYALTSDGRPCTQYLVAPGATTVCGAFHSRGALEVKNLGELSRYIWTIPKSELGPQGRYMQYVVGVYSPAEKKWTEYPSEPFTRPAQILLQ
jgi:hypothetical protein